MVLLIKAVLGGVVGVFLAWFAILAVYLWMGARTASSGSLGATAGGWNYLLQHPVVILLLSGAFGIGFTLTVRYAVRAGS